MKHGFTGRKCEDDFRGGSWEEVEPRPMFVSDRWGCEGLVFIIHSCPSTHTHIHHLFRHST